jgi:DNA-binding protein H-NS
MGELSSKLTRDDVDTLIESVDDWEMLGNFEFHQMNMIKNLPMLPEDHEAHEAIKQIKEYFRRREKEIMATREVKQEKAVFLKAKLMMIKRDMGINKLFEIAVGTDDSSSAAADKLPAKAVQEPGENAVRVSVKDGSEDVRRRLELAEFFINDLGVWDYYQKFLADREFKP